jgi:hypothetical protein
MCSSVTASFAAMFLLLPVALGAQSGDRSATIIATAAIAPRTSLHVSTRVLEFTVTPGSDEAVAVVEFTSAARALPAAEVFLTVKADGALAGPGGAADVETDLRFAGDVAGTLAGPMSRTEVVTLARWPGGGVRRGRFLFTLRAATPGTYTLPVTFAVNAL